MPRAQIRIPKRYGGLVMGLIMALLMSIIMSFVATVINLGFQPDFIRRWLTAYVGILPAAIPTAVLVTPIVKSFIDRITY